MRPSQTAFCKISLESLIFLPLDSPEILVNKCSHVFSSLPFGKCTLINQLNYLQPELTHFFPKNVTNFVQNQEKEMIHVNFRAENSRYCGHYHITLYNYTQGNPPANTSNTDISLNGVFLNPNVTSLSEAKGISGNRIWSESYHKEMPR
ncbi:unnamed protein product [Allacma fusca]|uniref:Uncharacterized protein n=1 Tax=Allacma fusca TaxID=39272 RepID=A0A8J2KDP7_9HEXA|nr:unnamed protein product [Allacma fusca]